eukprot:349679-Chlamydomonas_euryale.AAC.2
MKLSSVRGSACDDVTKSDHEKCIRPCSCAHVCMHAHGIIYIMQICIESMLHPATITTSQCLVADLHGALQNSTHHHSAKKSTPLYQILRTIRTAAVAAAGQLPLFFRQKQCQQDEERHRLLYFRVDFNVGKHCRGRGRGPGCSDELARSPLVAMETRGPSPRTSRGSGREVCQYFCPVPVTRIRVPDAQWKWALGRPGQVWRAGHRHQHVHARGHRWRHHVRVATARCRGALALRFAFRLRVGTHAASAAGMTLLGPA